MATLTTPEEIRKALLEATYENYSPEFDFSEIIAAIQANSLQFICYAVNWPTTGEYRLWFAYASDLNLPTGIIGFSAAYTSGALSRLDPDYILMQTNSYPEIPEQLLSLFSDGTITMTTSYVLEGHYISTADGVGYAAYLDRSILDPPVSTVSFLSTASNSNNNSKRKVDKI